MILLKLFIEKRKKIKMQNKENIIKALKSRHINSIDLLILAFDFEFINSVTHPNDNIDKRYSKKIELGEIKLPVTLNLITCTSWGISGKYTTINCELVYFDEDNNLINSHYVNGSEEEIYNSLKLILQTV
jgi:hypothetical protein